MSERPSTPADFIAHLAEVTEAIGTAKLGPELEDRLNKEFPAGGAWFATATQLCRRGSTEGWLCGREAGGIKFGRAAPAAGATHGMSIDVVDMDDVIGPHHTHPNGEIDLVMPLDSGAQFDGKGAGWKVYPPGSAHYPTVSGGRAIVLYLLPGGAIEFTRT
jgi:hypothetical protein